MTNEREVATEVSEAVKEFTERQWHPLAFTGALWERIHAQ